MPADPEKSSRGNLLRAESLIGTKRSFGCARVGAAIGERADIRHARHFASPRSDPPCNPATRRGWARIAGIFENSVYDSAYDESHIQERRKPRAAPSVS